MDTLVEKFDAKLREWRPESAEQVRQHVAEIIELVDLDARLWRDPDSAASSRSIWGTSLRVSFHLRIKPNVTNNR